MRDENQVEVTKSVLQSADEDTSAVDAETGPPVSAVWVYTDHEPEELEALEKYLCTLAELPFTCDVTAVVNGHIGPLNELVRLLQDCDLQSRIVQLHRAWDESTSINAGLQSSHGDVVVLLPTYLQSDPSALGGMIGEIDRHADYVASWRSPFVASRWTAFKSGVFNATVRHLTGVPLHDINSGLRVMRRDVVENLPIYGDLQRFLPILAAMQGYRVSEVRVAHLQERLKKGRNRIDVYLRRCLDMLTLFFLYKFTRKPLRFFGLLGSGSLAGGALSITLVTVQRFFFDVSAADRPMLLYGVLLIVLGVQLFSLGLLGELVIFTHGSQLRHQHVQKVYERESQE